MVNEEKFDILEEPQQTTPEEPQETPTEVSDEVLLNESEEAPAEFEQN